jgi:hypothetical protein
MTGFLAFVAFNIAAFVFVFTGSPVVMIGMLVVPLPAPAVPTGSGTDPTHLGGSDGWQRARKAGTEEEQGR